MKTVNELAREIENNQAGCKALLDCYRTTDETLRAFIISLKELPPSMVPALLKTFDGEHDKAKCKTFLDVIKNERIGTLFEDLSNEETYTWNGFNKDDEPTVIKLGSTKQISLDPSTLVRRIF
jgi:hypothetical protein